MAELKAYLEILVLNSKRGNMKYPYIGKWAAVDLIVLFTESGIGMQLSGIGMQLNPDGEFQYREWTESNYENITHEYLMHKSMRVTSTEWSELIQRLAFNGNFTWTDGRRDIIDVEVGNYITFSHTLLTRSDKVESNHTELVFSVQDDMPSRVMADGRLWILNDKHIYTHSVGNHIIKRTLNKLKEYSDYADYSEKLPCKEGYFRVGDVVLTANGKGIIHTLADKKGYYCVSIGESYTLLTKDELKLFTIEDENLLLELNNLVIDSINNNKNVGIELLKRYKIRENA